MLMEDASQSAPISPKKEDQSGPQTLHTSPTPDSTNRVASHFAAMSLGVGGSIGGGGGDRERDRSVSTRADQDRGNQAVCAGEALFNEVASYQSLELHINNGHSTAILRLLPARPPPTGNSESPPANSVKSKRLKMRLDHTSTFYTSRAALSTVYYKNIKLFFKEGLGKSGRTEVKKEAWWLTVLKEEKIAPRYLGLFSVESRSGQTLGRALASEWWGEALVDFGLIDETLRKRIYGLLKSLHKLGIQHGDFAPRNVCLLEGEPRLIDLGGASSHECGEGCSELQEARRMLKI